MPGGPQDSGPGSGVATAAAVSEMQDERFVSEGVAPVAATFDTGRMALGEPGLPGAFQWRGRTLEIATVLRSWRDTGPCRHGSRELYVRKHWFEAVTRDGATLKLYFDRQPRGGRVTARWWLYSIREPADGAGEAGRV